MCGPACMQGCGWQVNIPLRAFDVGIYVPPSGFCVFLNVFHVMDRLYDSLLHSYWNSPRFGAVMEQYRRDSFSGCVTAWL